MTTDNNNDVLFSEAPASWNTRYVTPDGFECQLTIRGEKGAEIAYRSGKLEYGASAREIAELSGVGKDTASRATRRLIDAGLITRVPTVGTRISVGMPYEYRLEVVHNDTFPHSIDTIGSVSLLHSHDTFRWGGLNKSGAEVWQALQSGPKTVSELVKLTGRHRSTIIRVLGRMSGDEPLSTGETIIIIELEGGRWRALDDVDLDQVAKAAGTSGKGEQQAKKHQAERRLYQARIDRSRSQAGVSNP